jgi:methyl-accepting chemotaxis protein
VAQANKHEQSPRKRRRGPKTLIQAVFALMDDVAELRKSAQFIADNIAKLSVSAAGIDRHAELIASQITSLTEAAAGIDTSAEKIAFGANSIAATLPSLQRLAEVVEPLDTTVARLGWFVDRIPGGKRS